jgi:hypothetical protein
MKCPECDHDMLFQSLSFDTNVIDQLDHGKEHVVVSYTYTHCNTVTAIKKLYTRGLYNCTMKPDHGEFDSFSIDMSSCIEDAKRRFRFP